MLEGYITPLLMSYIDRYVKNIKPSDLKLSFWGGDAVLRNLELRLDVLERELSIPLEFKSGKIRELVLHIPWNAIASTSVEITIRDMEFIVKMKDVRASLKPPPMESTDSASEPATTPKPQPSTTGASSEQEPGYLQGYLNRIKNNVLIHIQNLVVKVIEEECDMMITLNIGSAEYYTTDEKWEKKFIYTDYLQDSYSINKVMEVTDMAINLHAIEVGGQQSVGGSGTTTHEPFVQRCSFVVRMKSEYRGKIYLKKTINVLFDSITFSVDEKQFCLFLHFLDWLLAMYYSSKHLKGRDDIPLPSARDQAAPESKTSSPKSSPQRERAADPSGGINVSMTSSETKGQGSGAAVSDPGVSSVVAEGQGWGSWLMSFVGNSETEDGNSNSNSKSSESEKAPPNSTFAIFSKTVTVILKVTHQVQVPMFYSVQSYTSPVLHIFFTGCVAQLDKVPLTSLFLFSVGIRSVEASIMGLCPCVKKFPSSWRRANASNVADRTEEIPVFSMGASCDKDDSSDSISKVLLKRSLFDSESDSNTIELPPISEPDLLQLGEAFKAVWFTYLYFDIGPSRPVEECTEMLNIGKMRATFSPDVVHRLQHFIVAFQKSSEANPRFTEGMVVIGDPKAETVFKIKLEGGFASLTPNTHYLTQDGAKKGGVVTTPHKQTTPKHKRKQSASGQATSLPTLRATCEGVDVHIVQPMYRGNASAGIPQKRHLRASVSEIQLGLIKAQSLAHCLKPAMELTAMKTEQTQAALFIGNFDQFLSLPLLVVNQHSKVHGEEDKSSDASYFQIDSEKFSSSMSLVHISKILFIGKSWREDENLSSLTSPTSTNLSCFGHVHFSLTNATLSKSSNNLFDLFSVVLGELNGAIVTESDSEKLGHLVPVFYGPFDTHEWSQVETYRHTRGEGGEQSPMVTEMSSDKTSERLIELSIATPRENLKDDMFPAVQLSVGGCGLCLEPALVEFLKHLPLGVMATDSKGMSTTSMVQPMATKPSMAPPTLPLSSHAPTRSITPSLPAEHPSDTEKKHDFFSMLKSYATKVTIKPVLVVFPSRGLKTSSTSVVSPTKLRHSHSFPVLSHLSSSLDPTPSLILALPTLSISSAKSHVLDEPVPRDSLTDTFPWDCTLRQLTVLTVIGHQAYYILEPLTVKATLASQQEGTGVTVHADSLGVSVSKKQATLLNDVMSDLTEVISSLKMSDTSSDTEPEDSGIMLSEHTLQPPQTKQEYSSSVLSSPTYSTITPINAPTMSEVSTSSSLVFQGFSTLWIQILISKLALNMYSREKESQVESAGEMSRHETPSSVSSSYMTPLTSPTLQAPEVKPPKVKLMLEIDGASLQVDVQERCTDLIFKVTGTECGYFKSEDNFSPTDLWSPYLSSSNGKLFSSSSSLLPGEMCAPLLSPLPLDQLQPNNPLSYIFPPRHSGVAKMQPNFVHVSCKLPRDQPHKTPEISIRVHPFELVAWLPLVEMVTAILPEGKYAKDTKGATSKSERDSKPTAVVDGRFWPRLEISVECFRVVLPSTDYSNALLLSISGVQVTSSVDYVGPDVRFIVNPNAFKKLSHLSSEKRQPPLPAYQLDAYSISLWGMMKIENMNSIHTLLYASCPELKVVYTPPLYWTYYTAPPTSTSSLVQLQTPASFKNRSSTIAAGHSLEANLTSDVPVFIGPDQVSCAIEVLRTNTLKRREKVTLEDVGTDNSTLEAPSRKSTTPLKLLLTGRTLAMFLLTSDVTTSQHLESEDLTGTASPLLQALVYNPLFSFQSDSRDSKMEISCFNMAVGYTNEPSNVIAYSDLLDAQTVTTFCMKCRLFETKRGSLLDKAKLPPNLLGVSWSRSRGDVESASAGVISVDVGRPVKLSLSPFLLQELNKLLHHLLEMVRIQLPQKEIEDEDEKEGNDSSVFLTPQKGDEAVKEFQSNATSLTTEITISTSQLLIELELPNKTSSSSSISPTDDEASTPPLVSQETEVFLPGEEGDTSFSNATAHSSREGVLLAWDDLILTVPAGNRSCQNADLIMNGLQLVSLLGGHYSSFMVPPAQLECQLSHHMPCSPYDRANTAVNLSSTLLQFYISQKSVSLLNEVARSFSEALHRPDSPSAGMIPDEEEEEEETSSKESLLKVVYFKDDLRTGDFRYVIDESDIPRMPLHGDILFHSGGLETPPTMMWRYGEPRVVTRLHVLPVPFNITTEEDAPIDIKIDCSLEYWSDTDLSFIPLAHFQISEILSAEWLLLLSVAPPTVASRTWRVCLNHLEWVDDEMEEVFTLSKEDVSSSSGEPAPLSSVLSPLSLAASTRVDSIFSPTFIPTLSFSVHCQELEATLLHHPSLPLTDVSFNGYPVNLGCSESSSSLPPQELFRVKVAGGSCHLKHKEGPCTSIQIGGSVSLDYVDFRHLVWNTAVHPANLLLDMSYGKTSKINHVDAEVKCPELPELSIDLKCSPAVIRASQGLVHTAALTASAWKTAHLRKDRDMEGDKLEEDPVPFLLNHYILCNDTLENLHIGQVSTEEDTLLPSNSCLGYSWRAHKNTLQELHVCLVVDGVWRWSKPFSIDSAGVHAVQLPIGQHMATLFVRVDDIGGLQKQVTFFGSWKLFSSLHFPLEIQLSMMTSSSPPSEDHNRRPSSTSSDIKNLEESVVYLKTYTLPPCDCLPSILAADSQLYGVRVRVSKERQWSKLYPLGTSIRKWTKPQLLAEFESESGAMTHCWYNIKPIDSSTFNPWGNKITFSPLFLISNHLPFNLTMAVSFDSQPLAMAGPTEPSISSAASQSLTSTPLLLPGNGETVPLCSFNADIWYNLKFRTSEAAALSEPPVALSTFLLQHLPSDNNRNQTDTKPATAFLSLPLDDASSCSVHAALLRSSSNTITVELRPEAMLVNECSHLSLQLVEVIIGKEKKSEEGVREGEGVTVTKKERVTCVEPSGMTVLTQKEFMLRVEWHGRLLCSEPNSLPVISSGEKTKSKQDNGFQSVLIQLLETAVPSDKEAEEEETNNKVVLAQLILSFTRHDKSLTATVKPAYVLHNTTSHTLSIWPCIISKTDPSFASATHPDDTHAMCVVRVSPAESVPLIFWQNFSKRLDTGQYALCLRASGKEGEAAPSWSIYLSPGFVRHSFSLPVDNHFVPCLLTTHEVDDTTFLVVASDASPRVRIQNLCSTDFEVVQSGTKGIHMFPQVLPAGREVCYEPPSLAKLYPMVYDEDIATDRDRKLYRAAQNVSLRLRVKTLRKESEVSNRGTPGDWSNPFPLAYDQDKVLTVPGMGGILTSTDRQGHTLFISLLPTGGATPNQLIDDVSVQTVEHRMTLRFSCHLAQVVFSLCDEVKDTSYVHEVLRFIGDEADIHYSTTGQEGTKIDLTLQSLRIDNMTEKSTGEFAVTLLPRTEHAARPQLVKLDPPPLVKLLVHYNPHTKNFIDSLYVSIQPVTLQIEDSLLHKLRSLLHTFGLPGVLRTTAKYDKSGIYDSTTITPAQVLQEAKLDVSPLIIASLVIEPTAVYLKASITLKAFLSCNDSPFRFSRYELDNIYSNWSEVSQVIAARYISTTFMHIGWLLGSLELIGSPGTFIQSVGWGLRDLVSLPYEGITRSPSLFILGIGHGTASFFRQCSTGALTSITNLASSISRNMERLSMDPDHISYQDQKRKDQPATHFTSGLSTGVSSFGLSLMSAVAGIVDQPMQSIQRMDTSSATTFGATRSILAGVGKGLIGVVAKPVGGAMELVSQTGQGLMHGTGLTSKLVHKSLDEQVNVFTDVLTRTSLSATVTNCVRDLGSCDYVAVVPASQVDSTGSKHSSLLLLTAVKLYIIDRDTDSVQISHPIKDYTLTEMAEDTPDCEEDETRLELVASSSEQILLESGSQFESVERYLKLSEMESQEMKSSVSEEEKLREEGEGGDIEKRPGMKGLILLMRKSYAAQLVSVYRNLRQYEVDPEASYCVRSGSIDALRTESFLTTRSSTVA